MTQRSSSAVDPAIIRVPKRLALIVFGPLYFLFIAFVPWFCGRRSGFRGWYWRVVKRACSRLLSLLSIRVEMSQTDRQTLASDENSVLVVNHRSHLDGFALMDVIPDEKWFTFAAKKELCDAALLKTGFSGAGLVEIDRKNGKHAMETLGEAIRTMPARRSVLLFPEGTRAKTASLDTFKAGAVLAARAAGRTVRPIVIHGSDKLLPRGRFIPRSGTIRISVLPSIVCDHDVPVDADLARLRAAMTEEFDKGR